MKCLSKLYRYLDDSGEHPSSKILLRYIFKRIQRGDEVRIAPHHFKNGTDCRPLREHEIIEEKDGKIVLTSKARAMID